MPIPNTGQISLNDDVNATLQADTNEQDVSLKDNNVKKFAAVEDGDTISGRSMSELRGQTLFAIQPANEDEGSIGESLRMDGIESSHNSVKIFEPTTTAAPAFEATRGTFSFWVRIHETDGDSYYFYTSGASDSSDLIALKLHSSGTDHKFVVRLGTNYWHTESIFLDRTGWYNFVVAIDTNIISGDEQVKVYANGIPLNFSDTATLTVGTTVDFGTKQRINDWAFSSGYGVNATYGNFIFVDGNALLPNEFGELNYGIWVPKKVNKPSTNTLITTNLTANYDFVHGSIQDTSGNGNHLTKTGTGGTASQSNYGIWTTPGSTSSFLNMPDIINSHSTTISMWVHPKNLTSTEYFFHATKEIYGIWDITAGKYNVYFGAAGYVIQNMPAQDKWTMLTLTTTSARDVQFYIDGNLVNTITTGSDLQQDYNYYSNTIGYTHHTSTPNGGEMAFGEIQIYSTGLTAAQVLQNFNATKYKYFYGRHGWHFNFNNTDQGSIVSGSVINLDAGDWDADGTDETSFSGTTWSDKSGNNHHATLTNGPTYSSDNGGYFLFDGSDDFATITSNSSFQSLADFSLEMWIYPVSVSDDEMINLLYTSNTNYKWDLRFSSGSSRNFRWGVANSSGGFQTAQDLTTNTNTGAVDLNKWSHLVATFSSTFGVMSVYINGSLTDTKTGTFTTRTNGSENLLLAKRTDGYQANIGIAQSRVYSKALTPTEVVQNFRATQGHYNVLGLADISSNAKYASNNGSNLSGEDHSKSQPAENYATLNEFAQNTGASFSEGNLKVVSQQDAVFSTVAVNSGKWYAEVTLGSTNNAYIAIFGADNMNPNMGGGWSDSGAIAYKQNGDQYSLPQGGSSSTASYGNSYTSGDIIGIALDIDSNTITFYKNGQSQGTTANGPTHIGTKQYTFGFYAGTASATGTATFNFGQKSFAYTMPSGYKTLSSNNLPTATNVDPVNKKKPTDYFKTVLYTGNNASQKIRGLGFDPDFVWLKNRDDAGYHHDLYDTVRGDNLRVYSSQNSLQGTGYLQFKTDGFNLTSGGGGNTANKGHVAWCWKAGGPAVANSSGNIASQVSVNTAAGFSIVKYTGNEQASQTVGHGLSSSPEIAFIKQLDGGRDWTVPLFTQTSGDYMEFDTGAKSTDTDRWSAVSSTTFTVGADPYTNGTGSPYIGYFFHSIDGYQKIGTYLGNGSATGPFIYTGFRPAWIMIKRTDAAAEWNIFDNKRDAENPKDATLWIQDSTNESTASQSGVYDVDFLANGFQIKNAYNPFNNSSGTYLFMAIAEDPAKYSQGTGAVSDIEMFLDAKGAETSYPDNNFKAVNWTGTGYINFIDDVGFKPDFVWTNARSFGNYSQLFDSIRGVTKELEADTNSGEATNADSLTNFANNGFVLGTSNNENQNTSTYKAWCWKAGDTQVTKKPTYTSAGILTSNLVLHYNFADSNTYSTASNKFGENNKAAVFNGSSSIIRFADNSFKNTTFSVSMWVKSSDWTQSYVSLFNAYDNDGTNGGASFGVHNNKIWIFGAGGTTSPSHYVSTGTSLTDGAWQHVVYIVSGTSIKGYLNTNEVSDITIGSNLAYRTNHNFNIGAREITGTSSTNIYGYANAEIDQFRYFTSALTTDQISALYNETSSTTSTLNPTGFTTGIALLNFDSDSGTHIDDVSTNYDAVSSNVTFTSANVQTDSTIVNDLTSNNNNGTLVNSPTFVDSENGNYFDFDGSNDQLNLPNGDLGLGTNDFAVECWFNSGDIAQNDQSLFWLQHYQSPIRIGASVSSSSYGGDNDIRFYCLVGGTGTQAFTNSNIIDGNKWYHATVVKSSTTGMSVYVNGILVATNATATAAVTNNVTSGGGNTIAYYKTTASSGYFDGRIGQFRAYSTTLTQAQIRANYDATRTLYQGVGTTGNVLQTGLLNNIDVDSFDSYDPNSFGIANKAAVFNGTTSKFTITSPLGNASSNQNDNFTCSMWVTWDSVSSTNNGLHGTIVGDSAGSSYGSFHIYTYGLGTGNGLALSFERYFNGIGYYTSNFFTAGTLSNVQANQWHHIVHTYVGSSKQVKLYLDSVLIATYTLDQNTGTRVTNSDNVFGDYDNRGAYGHDGKMDQIRLFSSTLTADQVKILYNETSATTGTLNPTGLSNCVALYNFDSDSGTHVDDVSTNYDGVSANLTFELNDTTSYRAKDQTSNNLSGSLINATFNESNNWGTSIKFDGTGDFVNLPAGLGRTATQDVTRELWVKVDDYPASGSPDGLLYIGDMTEDGYYEFLRVFSDGSLGYMERNTNNAGGHNISFATDIGNTMLSENVWYHIVYTISGGTKKLYINGKIQVNKIFTDTKVNNSAYGGSLGAFRGNASATFHGEIAQFRSYTSELTEAQVKANFDATKAQFYSPLIHSTVSVNNKAGFSVVKYIGKGNETDLISHGQSNAPDFIITKRYDASGQSWNIRTPFSKNQANSLTFPIGSNDKTLSFNLTTGYADYTMDAQTNTAGGEYISYCFRNIPGYMKFGEYIGNGSTTGPRIYTGFRPRFIVTKHTSGSDAWKRWYFSDSATGIGKTTLYPNFTSGEGNYNNFNIFNDGFQIKVTDGTINQSGYTFFYWAIA